MEPSDNSGYNNANSTNLLEYPQEISSSSSELGELDYDFGSSADINIALTYETPMLEPQNPKNEDENMELEKSLSEKAGSTKKKIIVIY